MFQFLKVNKFKVEMMEMEFDFSLEPGKKIVKKEYRKKSPVISVIIPFYNDKIYIKQSVTCILNQTFPHFEILIIDDGSTDEESIKYLEKIEKLDDRIKVFHKKNEGLAATRDYGASKADAKTEFLLFLDSDDLIEPTYIECAYWTLITNEDASWAYSDAINFGVFTNQWNKLFSTKKMKKQNFLTSTAFIRKRDYNLVNGYELREKAVNEDWNFWLKLMAKGKFPVHMSFYGQWYRRKAQGELAAAEANKKRSLEIINKTAATIEKDVFAIQYPRVCFDEAYHYEIDKNIVIPDAHDEKESILVFIPKLDDVHADVEKLEVIKELSKKHDVIIMTTIPCPYINRQEFEKYSTVYDLSSFLDMKNWISFINYIIKKENIKTGLCIEDVLGKAVLRYLSSSVSEFLPVEYICDGEKKGYKVIGHDSKIYVSLDDISKKKFKSITLDKSDALKELTSCLNDSKRTMEKFVKKYIYEVYYKPKKMPLSTRIKNILWRIPLWRKFVNSKFWQSHIKRQK